jgi:hypothetical protein
MIHARRAIPITGLLFLDAALVRGRAGNGTSSFPVAEVRAVATGRGSSVVTLRGNRNRRGAADTTASGQPKTPARPKS